MRSAHRMLAGLLCAALVGACSPNGSDQNAASTSPSPTGGAAAPASAVPSSKITISYSSASGSELPLWLAKDEGYFDQNGLDADILLLDTTKGVPALLSGQIQVADIGGSEALSAIAAGADLVELAVVAPVYPFLFMVPSQIQTVDDLRGNKVGVTSFAGSVYVATRLSLMKVGLDPDQDVTLVSIGTVETRVAAMLNGAAQGAVVNPPQDLELEANGFHTLFDLAELNLPTAVVSLAAQRSYVTAHPDVVQRIIDALVEAIARARQDKPTSLAVLGKYLGSSDEAALNATYDYYVGHVIAPLPYPKPEQFTDAQNQLGVSNEQIRVLDLSSVLDPSFVASAAQRGLDH